MRMIVSFSSRDIKLQHDELIRSNQPDELRVLSRKLEIALRAWDSWVTYHQGSILSTGVASGCLEIDAAHLGELPKIAEQYRKAIDGTLAVGVGPTLMEALKAQEAVTGQDGIRLYTPDIEKELKEKEEPTAMEALGKADHEDAKDATAEIQNAPTVPQATLDLEAEFHKLATEQEDELKHNTDQSDAKQQTKAKVLEILQSVSKQSNKIATLKETSPQAFKAVMDLVGGVIEMARSFSKSEELIKSTPEGIKTYNMLLPKYKENGEKLRASNPPTPQLDNKIDQLSTAPTVIHLPSHVLTKIVKSGNIKNLYDTGTSTTGGMGDIDRRTASEEKSLHIDRNTDGSLRPVYGAVHHGFHDPTKVGKGPADMYGDVYLQLHPHVNERSTFTAHDSFDPNTRAVPHSHIKDVIRKHLHQLNGQEPIDDYIEAQIHGGVNPATDVHSLHITPKYRSTSQEDYNKATQRAVEFGRHFRVPVIKHNDPDLNTPPEKLYHPDDEVAKHEAAFLNPATGQVVTTGPTHDISFIPEDWTNATDGFVDSEGTFLTREEALNKALSLKNLPMPKKTPKRHPLNLPAGTQFDGDPQGAGTSTSGQEIIVENEDGKKIHRSVQAGSISAVNMRHAPPILGEATVPVSTKNPMGR